MYNEAKLRDWARNFLTVLKGYQQPMTVIEYETDIDSVVLLIHAARK